MITFKEVKVLDRNSELAGMPTLNLMENAGHGAAQFIHENYGRDFLEKGKKPHICFICGKGNNGGDGFVAARSLSGAGYENISLLLLARKRDIRSEISKTNFRRVPDNVSVIEYGAMGNSPTDEFLHNRFMEDAARVIETADIVVDAMLGVGISGRIRPPSREVIEHLNDARRTRAGALQVISLDVPSGFGGPLSVEADATATFHDIKVGMESLERVAVVDIGIPGEASLYVEAGEFAYYPVPGRDDHKGDAGRILVIGGGPFTGAPSLAALAAYRTGTDLVRIATPAAAAPVIASFDMNFMVTPLGVSDNSPRLLPRHADALGPYLQGVDAMLLGPGLGDAPETLETVIAILKGYPEVPAVLDADALGALARLDGEERCKLLETRPCILTPHRGEYSKLSGLPPGNISEDAVNAFARDNSCTVLVKGAHDIIAGRLERELKVNRSGHRAMTVGGTGDILSGCCTSFLCRGVPPFAAARMAAHLTGKAGETAFTKKGWGMMATDVVEELPDTLMGLLEIYNDSA